MFFIGALGGTLAVPLFGPIGVTKRLAGVVVAILVVRVSTAVLGVLGKHYIVGRISLAGLA